MSKTVLQTFKELNNLFMDAENDMANAVRDMTNVKHNLEDARRRLDALAAQFGFMAPDPDPESEPLPVRPPNSLFASMNSTNTVYDIHTASQVEG